MSEIHIYKDQVKTKHNPTESLGKRTLIKLRVEIRHCSAEIFIRADYNTGTQSNNKQH